MSYVDDIFKWLSAPKTIKGIVGMIVIIIVLAIDFAWWAGNVDVSASILGAGGGENVEEEELPENYDSGEISGNLPHGQKLFPFQQAINDPRGQGEGETYDLYEFSIESNQSEILIVSDGDPGSPQRLDGGDRNDIDLYLYEPGNEAGGDLENTQPDDQAATPSIKEQLSKKKLKVGNWTLRVDCFTGEDVSYTIHIQVFYGSGNETKEER